MAKLKKSQVVDKPRVLGDKVTKTKNKIVPTTPKTKKLRRGNTKTSSDSKPTALAQINTSNTKKLRVKIPRTPVGHKINSEPSVQTTTSTTPVPPNTPKLKKLRVQIFKTPLVSKKTDGPLLTSEKHSAKKLRVRIPKTPMASVTSARTQNDTMCSTKLTLPITPKSKKLQVRLHKTPLSSKSLNFQAPRNLVASTPLFSKSIYKHTSTPVDNLQQPSRNVENSKFKDYVTALNTPVNLRLLDISNVVGCKEQDSKDANKRVRNEVHGGKLPTAKKAKVNKENNEYDISANVNTIKTKVNGDVFNTSSKILRDNINLGKRSLGISQLTHNKTNDSHQRSLVKRLQADWTGTSFEESKTQMQNSNSSLLSLRKTKRSLAPLIEECTVLNESTAPTCNTLANNDESGDETYSSSEEFEADNEKENISLKRAPTWEILSNKTVRDFLPDMSSQSMIRSANINGKAMKEIDVRRTVTEAIKCDEAPKSNQPPKQKSNSQDSDNFPDSNTASSRVQKSRNLFNNTKLIEQVLSSSGEADENSSMNSTKFRDQSNANNTNCTKKFFVSRLENTTTVPVAKEAKSRQGRRTRARKEKHEQIYEFLSQSSTEGIDPASDVIEKMIKTGKVTVAKHKKGTGMLTIPRQRYRTRKKKMKAQETESKAQVMQKLKPTAVTNIPVEDHESESVFDEESVRDQRGFSQLARSAMIKEAGKNNKTYQRKMVTDKKQLLEMAQKFIGQSTPVRSDSPVYNISHLSPIAGSKSPWRADDDKLPNTFYFSRNTDNLPSFSSDYIPLTPSKRKSKSATSSYSSNDSNMENIAPPPSRNENPSTSYAIQNNPRQTLLSSRRSPLKAINILEVVNLPPLALNNFGIPVDDKENPRKNETLEGMAKETNPNDTSHLNNTSKTNADNGTCNNTSLFGFEEFLDEDDYDALSDVSIDPSAISNKDQLKERLNRLKRLRPENPVIETKSNNHRIQPIFDEHRTRQKTLKEMLCSTMIERPSEINEPHQDNDNDKHDRYFNDGYNIDLSNLFKDPEPETTFNESQPRRTYSRPFKRKRKCRHNFVMFMDSDVSEEDDDDKSVDYDLKRKKRTKNNNKDNAELNKFVNEFNEMCKEVTQYQLIVE